MKSIKILGIALFSLTLVSAAPPEGPYLTTEEMVGGFNDQSDVTVWFSAHNMQSTYYYFVYFTYIGQESYYMRKRVRCGEVVNGESELAFTFEFTDRLLDDGVRVDFQICDSSNGNNALYSQSFEIFPTFSFGTWVYANKQRKEDYVMPHKAFHFLEDGSVLNEEILSFKNTVDFVTNTVTNVMDISEISFWYNEKINEGISAVMNIADYFNDFPYMKKDRRKNIRIPIDIYQIGNDVYFRYKDNLYVNPETLEMSSSSRDGFVKTNQFYLPKDIDERFEELDMAIELGNFGYSNMSVKIPFSFYLEKKYLGMCDLANFCIRGGLKG